MTGLCSWCGVELSDHTDAGNRACEAAMAEQLDAMFFGDL